MARVALVHTPASGHVRPLRTLGRALAARGHLVTAYAPSNWLERVGGEGVMARRLELPAGLDPESPPDSLVALAALLLETGMVVAPRLIQLLEEDRPDVLVHDSFATYGRLAADAAKVPRVCLASTFAFTRRPPPLRAALALLRRETPDPRPLMRLRAARRAAHEQFGAPPGGGVLSTLANVSPTTLVCTSSELQPGGADLGAQYCFVGPLLEEVETEELEHFGFAPDRPLVYLSLGTLRNDRPDIYRAATDAARSLPVSLLMSIGHRVDPAAIGPLPENVVARPYVDQRAVLARSAAFITHAGMNSAHEALAHGVPMLTLPQSGDQFLVAARLDQLGAARAGRATPQRLKNDIQALLAEPRYRGAAAALADGLRGAGGIDAAVAAVLAA